MLKKRLLAISLVIVEKIRRQIGEGQQGILGHWYFRLLFDPPSAMAICQNGTY
jgi:hypothetical protein